jgi:hypothetical protein
MCFIMRQESGQLRFWLDNNVWSSHAGLAALVVLVVLVALVALVAHVVLGCRAPSAPAPFVFLRSSTSRRGYLRLAAIWFCR